MILIVTLKNRVYICRNKSKIGQTAMTERERRDNELVLKNAFQQLHLTVIDEKEMLLYLNMVQLHELRDKILDKVILKQRELGHRK